MTSQSVKLNVFRVCAWGSGVGVGALPSCSYWENSDSQRHFSGGSDMEPVLRTHGPDFGLGYLLVVHEIF